MVLGMLVGAAILLLGIVIGIKMQLPEEEQEAIEYPTTDDGKYYSAKTALRDTAKRGDD